MAVSKDFYIFGCECVVLQIVTVDGDVSDYMESHPKR